MVFKVEATGKEIVLHSFTGGADGAESFAGVIRDAEGNLYGTTYFGGSVSGSLCAGVGGCGVAFKLDPAGRETVLHTFSGGADGANPNAGLVQDLEGNLYGCLLYTSYTVAKFTFLCGRAIVKRLLAFLAWAPELLQFRVLRFRLFQDGNIRVGVFPEG